jgi:hypothetical protein
MSSSQNLNTIIFTIARMNPPTPGHLSLITYIIKEAVRLNVPKVFLILSKTNNSSKDPIPCDKNPNSPELSFKTEVIDLMVAKLQQKLGTNVSVICRCVSNIPSLPGIRQPTTFSTLSDIIYKDFKDIKNLNLIMFVGDDRASLIDSVTSSYYLKDDNIRSMDGKATDRPEMTTYKNLSKEQLEDLSIESMPSDSFSGSFVRKLVFYGLKNKFDDVYRPYLNQSQIDALYNTLLKGQTLGEPKKEKEEETYEPKYKYPLSKGTGGSKKRRYKKRLTKRAIKKRAIKKTFRKRTGRTKRTNK